MKKQISLRMWLSVFFGGIWQFIRNIFKAVMITTAPYLMSS